MRTRPGTTHLHNLRLLQVAGAVTVLSFAGAAKASMDRSATQRPASPDDHCAAVPDEPSEATLAIPCGSGTRDVARSDEQVAALLMAPPARGDAFQPAAWFGVAAKQFCAEALDADREAAMPDYCAGVAQTVIGARRERANDAQPRAAFDKDAPDANPAALADKVSAHEPPVAGLATERTETVVRNHSAQVDDVDVVMAAMGVRIDPMPVAPAPLAEAAKSKARPASQAQVSPAAFDAVTASHVVVKAAKRTARAATEPARPVQITAPSGVEAARAAPSAPVPLQPVVAVESDGEHDIVDPQAARRIEVDPEAISRWGDDASPALADAQVTLPSTRNDVASALASEGNVPAVAAVRALHAYSTVSERSAAGNRSETSAPTDAARAESPSPQASPIERAILHRTASTRIEAHPVARFARPHGEPDVAAPIGYCTAPAQFVVAARPADEPDPLAVDQPSIQAPDAFASNGGVDATESQAGDSPSMLAYCVATPQRVLAASRSSLSSAAPACAAAACEASFDALAQNAEAANPHSSEVADLDPDPAPSPFGDAKVVAAAELAETRGGFEMTDQGQTLRVSFGIERAVYVNGALVSTSTLALDGLNRLTEASQGGAGPGVRVSGSTADVLRNGPGNTMALGAASLPAGMVSLQNSLDNQVLGARTVINAVVEGSAAMRAARLESMMRDAAVGAVRR